MPTLILRSYQARPWQLLLAVLCITIALGAGITAIGFAESVKRGISAGSFFRTSDLLVLQADKASTMTSRLPVEAVDAIGELDGIRRVRLLLFDFLTLNEKQNVLVYGMPSEYPELQLRDGEGSRPLGRHELLVGKGVAALADMKEGETIDLNFGSFRVAGLLDTGSFLENGIIYMRLEDMQRLTGAAGHVSFVLVELGPNVAPHTVAGSIESQVPGSRVLTNDEFVGEDQTLQVLHSMSRVVLITNVMLAALLAGAIMMLSVNERYHELAILRAIGWSSVRIAILIGLEVILLILIGGLLGSFLGWIGLGQALSSLRSMGVYIESAVTPPMVLMAAMAVAVTALVGAATPVWQVLRLDVWEALKKT
jgi:putative ABC transport system permease protein